MTPVRTRRIIDDAGAEAVLAAAERKAHDQGSRVVMAVVDPWGEVVALRRTEGAQAASSRVAVDKARTAAIFIRPSREMEQQVTDGRLGALALHGAAALIGGIPLTVDGEVVGAIGTSGETPDEDEAISIAGAAAELSTVAVPALTFDGAKRIAEAAGAAAAERGVAPVISVVDAGGALMYLVRPDAAQVASVEVTTDKARTAAIYRRPSKDFEDQASGGRPSALHLARAVPLQGGMPIIVDGEIVGAIGVSGARSADEDQELAVIGAGSASANGHRNGVAHFPRAQVDSGRGILLDEGRFKLDAGRRTGPGEVELHEHAIDVMHVVRGTATVVTGGDTPHEIAEGDVLTIPAGVTHQFTEVSDPFLYFVVKVED
jgi:glc operon protein GlcG